MTPFIFCFCSTPSPNSGNAGVGGREPGTSFQIGNNDIGQSFVQDLATRPPRPVGPTTAIPISVTTTTRRPPRVKSNLQANKANKFQNKRPKPTVRPDVPIEFAQPDITEDRSKDPFRNPPLISADGKKPRVKSNLNFNQGKKFDSNGFNKKPEKSGLKASQKVPFQQDKFKFIPPADEEVLDYEVDLSDFNNPSSGPEVRPDGRLPRVKSNIEALRTNQGRKVNNSPVSTTENIFNLIPTGRPQVASTVRPLPPAPTVEPIRENIDQFSNFPFRPSQRPAGAPPRVKSNLSFNKKNKKKPSFFGGFDQPQNNNFNQFRPTTPAPPVSVFQPEPETTTPNPGFFSSTVRTIFTDPIRPPEEESFQPEFIDEQDEFNTVAPPQFFSSTTRATPTAPPRPQRPQISTQRPFRRPTASPKPSRPKETRPRVKSNILARKRNRFREKDRSKKKPISNTRNKVNFSKNKFNFVSKFPDNVDNQNEIEDDDNRGNSAGGFSTKCNNPFKCRIPTRTADGRKPRVKSNIKARNRNYFHPSTSKTNRIRGKPSFNQFVKGNLRTRTGKAQRRPFQKVIR